MSKAATTPWTMRIINERAALVLGAKGEIVGAFRILDARMVVEGVNERARLEEQVYNPPAYEWDIEAVTRGAYRDDTL